MFPGPVFNVELLTLARRKRYYALRFFYGMFLLYLIWLNYASYAFQERRDFTRQELAQLGMVLFSTFSITQSLVILLITPALVAGVVADERQRKTLQYLLASCLSSGQIVLGKLAARMLSLAVFVGVGLPVVAMLSFMGGVDPNNVLFLFAGSASTVFLMASASIAVSVHARRPREAVTVSYLLELGWLFGPAIVAAVMPSMGGRWSELYEWFRPINEWAGTSSPFFVLIYKLARGFANQSAVYESIAWMIGVQVVLGTVFALIAVLRLRPVNRSEGDNGGRISAAMSRQARRLLPRPGCGDDALLWKERYVSRTSPLSKIVGGMLFLGVVGLLGYTTYQFAAPVVREIWVVGYASSLHTYPCRGFNEYLRVILSLVSACWMLATASAAASTVTSERESDTWISLIATPLTPLEIIRAKMLGALWGVRWVGLIWGLLLLTGVVLGAVHPVGLLAELVVTVVYLWFASALGTFFSLRSRNSSRSLIATLAALLVCNGLYLLVFIPFDVETSIPLLGVTPYMSALVLVSYPDIGSFLNGGMHLVSGSHRSFDFLMTVLASLIAYAIAAGLLNAYLVFNFDDAIDRPRTEGGRPPKRSGVRFSPDEDEDIVAEETNDTG